MMTIRSFLLALFVVGAVLFAFLWHHRVMDGRFQSLQQTLATVSAQSQYARDYIDLANLQAAYGYYVDKAQWDDAADLFARDATLEIAGRGLFSGQDRIRTYLQTRGELRYGRLYNHMQLQPVIHINQAGNEARARWRSFMQVGELGGEARWGEATYNNAYIKENGVWKIQRLHSFINFYVEYDEGWHRGGVALPPGLDDLPPDADQTIRYGAFPEVFVPPFHYDNPVSGRPR